MSMFEKNPFDFKFQVPFPFINLCIRSQSHLPHMGKIKLMHSMQPIVPNVVITIVESLNDHDFVISLA